jgi:thiamine pyrophosphate-dependent acetolactate synthase large subunit-like protein
MEWRSTVMDRYGSDVAVETWADLGIDHVILNPGASVSGIHDSLGTESRITSVLALHENVALSAADGFARAAGRPAGVVLHNLVGLQSGAMGIFNAWANQVPVCIVGGAGPMDWSRRRPWIDWVHSGKPQAMAVRDVVKWHDQPTSQAAVPASLRRGHQLAVQGPAGPTYVAVDVPLQESESDVAMPATRVSYQREIPLSGASVREIAASLTGARFPVIIADLVGNDSQKIEALVALAERSPAALIDLGGRMNVPSRHWADCTFARNDALRMADVVLLLDVRDSQYALCHVNHRDEPPELLIGSKTLVYDVSLRSLMSGQLVDYASTELQGHVLTASGSTAVDQLVQELPDSGSRHHVRERIERLARAAHPLGRDWDADIPKDAPLDLYAVSAVTWRHVGDGPFTVANGDLRGWLRACWDLDADNRFLGRNLGAGLGYGIGASIGAALALQGQRENEIVVNFQNDGDLLYTASGLWTAARYELPILTVVVNNRAYGQDKRHAERLLELRGRSSSELPEGLLLDQPLISFSQLAMSQGVRAWGPATTPHELDLLVKDAVQYIRASGKPALVDAHVAASSQRLVSL